MYYHPGKNISKPYQKHTRTLSLTHARMHARTHIYGEEELDWRTRDVKAADTL